MNESNSSGPEYRLVSKARSGDLESFEALVNLYAKRIFHIAYKIIESIHDAEDVLQETFLKAFENLPQFRGDSSFYTWIVQIAVNAALQRVKKQRQLQMVPLNGLTSDDDEFRPQQIVVWDDDPEKLYSRKETQRILEEAITSLPIIYRTVFLLKDVENMSMAKIARTLEISLPAAKSRLIRARLELRELLSGYFKKRGAPVYSGPHHHGH
jgi:RNA polymerase sigma-70 factor (ECF subfamily)